MKKIPIIILCLMFALSVSAQDYTPRYRYRVTLKDKKGTPFTTSRPEQFLSAKAIERRKKQKLKIDKTDLPVSPVYLTAIRQDGVKVIICSKWNNTVLVETTDTTLMDKVRQEPFVTAVRKVAVYTKDDTPDHNARFAYIKTEESKEEPDAMTVVQETPPQAIEEEAAKMLENELGPIISRIYPNSDNLTTQQKDSVNVFKAMMLKLALSELTNRRNANEEAEEMEEEELENVEVMPVPESEESTLKEPYNYYGKGWGQLHMMNLDALHNKGYKGAGMTIAIIDGGFYNADIIPMLKNVTVLGYRDFVNPGIDNVFEQELHGTMVLSCIGTNQPGTFVGTAPEASFWLLRSEDGHSEQLVEEDTWCAAIEFADSVGADVVNTSLGYTEFDNKADNVRYYELDGKTHLISRSASMAANKGMVCCQSAGNSAFYDAWKLIGAPADADNILTVGAVNNKRVNTLFSSIGNSYDGRIKPDVCAQGEDCTVIDRDGTLTTADGTSFSSPIMCGSVACFWQANPKLTAKQVISLVRALGDNAEHPDNVFGWGIPDYSK
jgi:subtilisin family serine protease